LQASRQTPGPELTGHDTAPPHGKAGPDAGAGLVGSNGDAANVLALSSSRWRGDIYDALACGVLICDAGGAVVDANKAAQEILGQGSDALRALGLGGPHGLTDADGRALAREDDPIAAALRTSRARRDVVLGVARPDGSRRWLQLDAVPIAGGDMTSGDMTSGGAYAGRPVRVVVSFLDVTAHKKADQALWRQALHDPLTDLPNRTLLFDRLRQAVLAAGRDGATLALLLLDLDRFKEINDTLGHHVGDLALQEVAERLSGALRASDTVARLGGDEFAVILPRGDRAGATRAARKIGAALKPPVEIDGRALHVGASIGIALYPPHGADPQTLLRRADVAMYVAKRESGGSGYAVYAPARDEHSPERLALGAALRHAIAHDELLLHYQPRVDLQGVRGPVGKAGASDRDKSAGSNVSCVEALARWRRPCHGLVPPDQFIPLAERTGLIGPLTRWVLDAALRQCSRWRRDGLELAVAVNLSASNLRDPRLADTIVGLLGAYGLPATALRLELTESTIMSDAETALKMLGRLAGHGIHISIDDYGTGYSSLSYLKRLPVAELKIDKSFVLHMAEDAADAAIVSSTIGLAHSLGLRVVAEGVEDERSRDLLAAMKCDAAQGYYLSRPLGAEDLTRWLSRASL